VIGSSPFSCMVSRDNAGIPIHNFYFDGTQSNLQRDLEFSWNLPDPTSAKPCPRELPLIAKTASVS